MQHSDSLLLKRLDTFNLTKDFNILISIQIRMLCKNSSHIDLYSSLYNTAALKTPQTFSPSRRRRWSSWRSRMDRWVWKASWPWDRTAEWPWFVWPSIWLAKAVTRSPWTSLVNGFLEGSNKNKAHCSSLLMRCVCLVVSDQLFTSTMYGCGVAMLVLALLLAFMFYKYKQVCLAQLYLN